MVSQDTLGDSESLVELGKAGTGLVPWEASVSTALHPQRGKEDGCGWDEFHFPPLLGSGISGQCFLLPVKVWMRELLSCLRALNKVECPAKLRQTANITNAG